MMTNATVANAVKGVDGQTVTVTYKGGEKKIDIPAMCRLSRLFRRTRPTSSPVHRVRAIRTSIGWILDQRRRAIGKDGGPSM